MRKSAQIILYNCAELRYTPLSNKNKNMNTVILQIPLKEYGTIATLAAAAKMPLDKYIAKTAVAKKTIEEEKAAILAEK